ncbi:CD209 antigen-like protein C [Rhineura floridana]|uniref:CD209 antigen-like protein C n=1 Tax=Rhineura floridana TaxID=261503 RepID=UPI002AC885FC|nr:CD209 antigen-like protein C [Rhineura floridana]
MAPKVAAKDKETPPPPKQKGAPAVGAARRNPFKRIPPKVGWMFLGTFALLCFCVLITMAVLYVKMAAEKKSPLDEPMKKLKSTMATGLRNNKLNHESPMKIAEEVVKLPAHIADAEKVYNERRLKYQNLFRKGARSVNGWKLFGRSLYYISKGKKTWYDAENFCMSRDAHLASILTDEEQIYITSQLSSPAWIGLSDENEEGNWEWTDGSRFITQYWSGGNPSRWENYGDMEQDCTTIIPSPSEKNWNDGDCHELHRWVCKESLDVEEP